MGRKKKQPEPVIPSNGFYQRITLLPDGERRVETLPINPNKPIPLGPVTIDLSTPENASRWQLAKRIYVEALLDKVKQLRQDDQKEEGTG